MKVLNLYAGIGGNRTLWEDCEITAVELNPTIADFYRKRFPQDEVIVGDARSYLLDNYKRFSFIWSSYPCQSHSRARFWNRKLKPVFPDFRLYEEIVFLREFFQGDWIVENVFPYYSPLIEPAKKIGRHLFWSNRSLQTTFQAADLEIVEGKRSEYEAALGFGLGGHKFDVRKDQLLRNCVHPDLGRDIFNYFRGIRKEDQTLLFD